MLQGCALITDMDEARVNVSSCAQPVLLLPAALLSSHAEPRRGAKDWLLLTQAFQAMRDHARYSRELKSRLAKAVSRMQGSTQAAAFAAMRDYACEQLQLRATAARLVAVMCGRTQGSCFAFWKRYAERRNMLRTKV